MCEIDGLMNRIRATHDPLDKRALDRIIKLERDKKKLEDEVEKLKPYEAICKMVSA